MFGFRNDEEEQDDRPPRQQRGGGGGGGQGGALHTEKIVTERKIFFMDLKENDRGRFVKITEDVRGRRDTIMVPMEHLDDIIDSLTAIRDVEEDL